jgi:hypothetical protein
LWTLFGLFLRDSNSPISSTALLCPQDVCLFFPSRSRGLSQGTPFCRHPPCTATCSIYRDELIVGDSELREGGCSRWGWHPPGKENWQPDPLSQLPSAFCVFRSGPEPLLMQCSRLHCFTPPASTIRSVICFVQIKSSFFNPFYDAFSIPSPSSTAL